MIDQVDLQLKSWADGIVGSGLTDLSAPAKQPPSTCVSFYLIDLISIPSPRTPRKIRLEIWLRYLVSAWSQDPAEGHRLIGELLFAALANPDFTVESDAVPATVWGSFGIAPRPGFFLKVPCYKELPERPVKYVRQPMEPKMVPTTTLTGVITGPQEIPLSGALVELPALSLATRTDAQGVFRFANVAAEPSGQFVRVRAKGREQTFRSAEYAQPDGSVHFHFKFEFEEG